jgi:hypothetical protein
MKKGSKWVWTDQMQKVSGRYVNSSRRPYISFTPSEDVHMLYTRTLANPCLILKGGAMYLFFEESLPWFESKLNQTRLEYLPCTYFEQVSRNVRSKPNLVVSVLLIRSRLQAINCSSFELKMFSSLWGSWLVFGYYPIVVSKDAVHHRREQ